MSCVSFHPRIIILKGITCLSLLVGYVAITLSKRDLQERISWGITNFFNALSKKTLRISVQFHTEPAILKQKKCIILPIHNSHWEAPIISSQYKTYSIIKKEALFKAFTGGGVMAGLPALYIDRSKQASFRSALGRISQALTSSHVLLFPEGGSTLFSEPCNCQSLVYFLAKQNPQTPLIPVVHTCGFFFQGSSVTPKRSGTAIIQHLEPIYYDPKENGRDFLKRLSNILQNGKDQIEKKHYALNP